MGSRSGVSDPGGFNPFKWPYLLVSGVITLLTTGGAHLAGFDEISNLFERVTRFGGWCFSISWDMVSFKDVFVESSL